MIQAEQYHHSSFVAPNCEIRPFHILICGFRLQQQGDQEGVHRNAEYRNKTRARNDERDIGGRRARCVVGWQSAPPEAAAIIKAVIEWTHIFISYWFISNSPLIFAGPSQRSGLSPPRATLLGSAWHNHGNYCAVALQAVHRLTRQ